MNRKNKNAEPSKADLASAAEDLNLVLGLDPPIDLDLNEQELIEKITANSDGKEGVYITDELKESTWEVLSLLGVGPKKEEKTKKEKSTETKPKAEVKEKKEPKQKKEVEKKEAAKKEVEKKETPVKKTVAKEDRQPHYSREFSTWDALKKAAKKGLTIDELVESSNSIYVKKGGKDNAKQSLHVATLALKYLVYAGAVETFKNGDKFRAAI